MAFTDTFKTDILFKKVIGEVSETTQSGKDYTGETLASPLIVRSDSIWTESTSIPSTAPGSTTGVVIYYGVTTAKQLKEDLTVSGHKTWVVVDNISNPINTSNRTNSKGWIGPAFDSNGTGTYAVSIYTGDPNAGGVLQNAGNSPFEWYFDYSSGVLHFPNSVPASYTNGFYIVGYRYNGIVGAGSTFSLNGLTANPQTFATGTSGTDFGISSSGSIHTFNIPSASATARGLLTTGTQTLAGNKTFQNNLTVNGVLDISSTGTVLTFSGDGDVNAGAGQWSWDGGAILIQGGTIDAQDYLVSGGSIKFSSATAPSTPAPSYDNIYNDGTELFHYDHDVVDWVSLSRQVQQDAPTFGLPSTGFLYDNGGTLRGSEYLQVASNGFITVDGEFTGKLILGGQLRNIDALDSGTDLRIDGGSTGNASQILANTIILWNNTDTTTKGKLGFWDLDHRNNSNAVFIQAVDNMTTAYTLTLPDDLPGSTMFLQSSDTGILSWGAGASVIVQGEIATDSFYLGTHGGTLPIGDNNVDLGVDAGRDGVGSDNIRIGKGAARGAQFIQSVIIGGNSLNSYFSSGTADLNTMVGYGVGQNLAPTVASECEANTFIGNYAGGLSTTGKYSIAIGANSDPNNHNSTISFGDSAFPHADYQWIVGREGTDVPGEFKITDAYFGKGYENTVPEAFTLHATGGKGADIAGADLVMAPGQGTGTGIPGKFLIKVAPVGSTGSTLNSLVTAITVNEGYTSLHGKSSSTVQEFRFLEASTNGSNYTGFKAPTSLAGNTIYQLPNAYPASNKVLQSDSSGTLTWADGGIGWSVVTGTTQAMAINNGYIANHGTQVAFSLPTTAAVGSIVRITGINTAIGWKITQAASQQIHFGTTSTTSGTGGYLESTQIRDSVELLCVVADLQFNVISSVGNITIV